MTFGKLFTLFDKYCEWHGLKKETDINNIIPDVD